MKIPLDIVGDIAILKFGRYVPWVYKKFYAWKFLRENKQIKVVLEKTAGFSGVLRIQETKWISGDKRKDTIHRENGCSFYLDVDETYFSPRLSQDRRIIADEIAKKIKNNSKILVMFAGVSPLPIVIAKTLKEKKIKAKIFSSELNKKACDFGKKNLELNKVTNYVDIYTGDSRKFCDSSFKKKIKFDYILMMRPNLKETFLDSAVKVANKGTIIYYHGFGEVEGVREEIVSDLNKLGCKFSSLEFRKSGDIGVRKNRYSVKFKVL